MITKDTPKTPKIFHCKQCDFNSSNKKDYHRHLLTNKHKMITNDNCNDNALPPKNSKLYICECGNEYIYQDYQGIKRSAPLFKGKIYQILITFRLQK